MKAYSIPALLLIVSFVPLSARAATDDSSGLTTISTLVAAIRKSGTPSDAVAAYANAAAKAGQDLSIRQAFVVRMVELHHPELAEAQANELTDWTNDGMPWAVLAYAKAQRGKMDTALTDIATAVRHTPDNAFVVKTAGQLLAWYDTRMNPSNESNDVIQAAKDIRSRLSSRSTFAQAYDQAHDMLAAGNVQVDPNAIDPAEITKVLQMRRGTFMVSGDGGNPPTLYDSPLAMFYLAPYAIFPGYDYAYQPWAPDIYYASGWWNRSITRDLPFPGPRVDPDTRYYRLPGVGNSGFALVGDNGTVIYQANASPFWGSPYGPFYGGYGMAYYGPTFAPGFPVYSSGSSGRAFNGPGRLRSARPGGFSSGIGRAIPGYQPFVPMRRISAPGRP